MDLVKQLAGRVKRQNVEIFVGKQKCCSQPETFSLCPLGLQFYSPRKLADLSLLEFSLAIPGARRTKPVTCTGAVVRCEHQKKDKRYRVWVQFLDLPEKAREKIRCVSRDGKHLCCYCENF
jgi:hypothetical protein